MKLVEALAGKFEPEKYSDRFREQVEAMIAAKIQGREVASAPGQAESPPPVIDIMDALKKSLEAARKPVAKAQTSAETRSKPKARQAKRR